jgi:hypothetical protein
VIEVKSTGGNDFRFHMKRSELRCAQKYKERYKLYRVVQVASATPKIFIFENPYLLWQQGKALVEPSEAIFYLPTPPDLAEDE